MDVLFSLLGVGVATFAIFGYLLFIWWLDRYEREPLWLVLLVFAWGGFGGTAFGCGFSLAPSILLTQTFGEAGSAFGSVVLAPVVEEFTKGLIFVPLILSKHFDNETDGLIYGAATGLGFACIENLTYYSNASSTEELWSMLFIRTMFTALVHCISSATLGMAVGWARGRRGAASMLLAVLAGYALAVTNHAVWNGTAVVSDLLAPSGAEVSAALLITGCLLVVGASAVMFLLTQVSLWREHGIIKKHLAVEADRGTIPVDHVSILPYWTRRFGSGWLPPGVPKRTYVQVATLLAFRHMQRETAQGDRAARIERDIEEYRERLRNMLRQRQR